MKILWLCNTPLPSIAIDLSIPISNGGGWLVGISNDLKKAKDINLTICFMLDKEYKIIKGKVDNIEYYGVPKKIINPTEYDISVETHFKNILNEVKPDVIHIFGTEFPHTLSMVKSTEFPNKVVINIQGLCSMIAKHYLTGIPTAIQKSTTFRDFLKKDNIINQKEKFAKRGKFEIEALQKVNHVIGRTTWDKACTSQINPVTKYHFCNETLRNEFYNHIWDKDKCERHSLFISQASYPIKGLHIMLEAMPIILNLYPDTKLYIAGRDITKADTIKEKLKITSYGKYIKDFICNNNLQDHIVFTGNLDEKQMCERYLKSNVFILPSSIENSPNSLGEAMLLGVPIVSADVGGVKDMTTHNVEGFIYQQDAPYMLAYYICQLFQNEKIVLEFSKNARKKALIIYDKEKNLKNLLNIYKTIGGITVETI